MSHEIDCVLPKVSPLLNPANRPAAAAEEGYKLPHTNMDDEDRLLQEMIEESGMWYGSHWTHTHTHTHTGSSTKCCHPPRRLR